MSESRVRPIWSTLSKLQAVSNQQYHARHGTTGQNHACEETTSQNFKTALPITVGMTQGRTQNNHFDWKVKMSTSGQCCTYI